MTKSIFLAIRSGDEARMGMYSRTILNRVKNARSWNEYVTEKAQYAMSKKNRTR